MSVKQQEAETPVNRARPDETETLPARPVRKAWSAPSLSVHSIDDTTMGTRANTKLDGGNFIS